MGIYDDLKLDKTIDRNSFTPKQAAEVFAKAAAEVKSDLPVEIIDKLLDAGFLVLRIFAASQA